MNYVYGRTRCVVADWLYTLLITKKHYCYVLKMEHRATSPVRKYHFHINACGVGGLVLHAAGSSIAGACGTCLRTMPARAPRVFFLAVRDELEV